MSAADRMVVRTGSGAYKSLPRRTALGLIAAGRAQIAPKPEAAHAPLTPADEPPAPVMPATPDSPPAPQEHTQTTAPAVGDAEPDVIPVDIPAAPVPVGPDETLPDGEIPTVYAVELPPEPKSTARRAEWADYADSLGVEVTSAMTKTQIQVAAEEAAQSLSNLPQPALTGGRLETPEDEPAAETVADDPDTRTR